MNGSWTTCIEVGCGGRLDWWCVCLLLPVIMGYHLPTQREGSVLVCGRWCMHVNCVCVCWHILNVHRRAFWSQWVRQIVVVFGVSHCLLAVVCYSSSTSDCSRWLHTHDSLAACFRCEYNRRSTRRWKNVSICCGSKSKLCLCLASQVTHIASYYYKVSGIILLLPISGCPVFTHACLSILHTGFEASFGEGNRVAWKSAKESNKNDRGVWRKSYKERLKVVVPLTTL